MARHASGLPERKRDELYRLATREAAKLGLGERVVSQQALTLFRNAIVAEYVGRVRLSPGPRGNNAERAERFGVDRSTYKRWIDGKLPRADSFCLLAAADDVVLPRGAFAVLSGCCKLFEKVKQLRFGGRGVGLTRKQAVCLWAVVRSAAWWEACATGDPEALSEGRRDVIRLMKEWRRWRHYPNVANINATIDGRLTEWMIVEFLLQKHEWLGSVDSIS
jgi:hypothetical protein